MTLAIILGLLVVTLLGIGGFAGGRKLWRSLSSSPLTRQLQLELAGETARSPAHRAATGWRKVLDAELVQTRRMLASAHEAHAPVGDLGTLVETLARAVGDLDRQLALLGRELDPSRVDHVLRTDLGRRAEELVHTASRLRDALSRSISSGSAAHVRDLVGSADLSVTALSSALDELDKRDELDELDGIDSAARTTTLASSPPTPHPQEEPTMSDNASQTTDQLTCPKCHGTMRRYERSGVVIDQCSDCRGIFLDAGELETIMRAEDAHYNPAPPQQQQQPPQPQQQPGYPPQQQGYPQQGYGTGGFLGGLFGDGHHGGGRRHH